MSALRESRGWAWRTVQTHTRFPSDAKPGSDTACGTCALAERQRQGGELLGSQEGIFEVMGGDRRVTKQRGHRALKGWACRCPVTMLRAQKAKEREERKEVGSRQAPGGEGPCLQGWGKVSKPGTQGTGPVGTCTGRAWLSPCTLHPGLPLASP